MTKNKSPLEIMNESLNFEYCNELSDRINVIKDVILALHTRLDAVENTLQNQSVTLIGRL